MKASRRPAAAAAAAAAADVITMDDDDVKGTSTTTGNPGRDRLLSRASRAWNDPVPKEAQISMDDPHAPLSDAAVNRACMHYLLPIWKIAVKSGVWKPEWKFKIHYPIALSLLIGSTSRIEELKEEAVIMTTVCTMEKKQGSSASHVSHYVAVIYDTRKKYRRITVYDPLGYVPPQPNEDITDLEKLVQTLHERYSGVLEVNCIDDQVQSDGYQCGVWLIATFEAYVSYAIKCRPKERFEVTRPGRILDLRSPTADASKNEKWVAWFRSFLAEISDPVKANPVIEQYVGLATDYSAFLK
jgi:hypothetical protein